MKHLQKCWALIVILALSTGCATGPKFGDTTQTILPLNPAQGRIFIYRVEPAAAFLRPDVMLNAEKVGDAIALGFFYVDRPPGAYEIVTTTEVKKSLSFMLEPGQTRFVRLNVSVGLLVGHIYPEAVTPLIGEIQLKQCSYTGNITGK